MEAMDAKVFTLIVAGTAFVLEVLKRMSPKLRASKNVVAGLALLLPVVFTVAAKVTGQFAETSWIDGLLWAMGGGVGAGIANDKIVNPALKALSGLLGAPDQTESEKPSSGGEGNPS